MFFTKLKTVMTVLLVAGLIGIGGGLVTYGTVAGQTGQGDRPGIQGQGTTGKKDSAATNTEATKQDTAKEISNTDAAHTDMEKLQGTWKVVQMTSNGKQFDSQKGNSWKIDGQKIVMTPGFGIGKNPTGPTEATFQLGGDRFDTKPAPNGINLTHPGMRAMRGIYAWDQEKLEINFSTDFWTRPNEIPPNPAKYQMAYVLEREKDADPTSLDWVRLQGQWKIVGYETNGKKKDLARYFPKDFNNKEEIEAVSKVIFDGDRFIMPEGLQETSFKLNATKTPKQFAVVHIKEDGKEEKLTGIYSLDGDDLKICVGNKKEADSPPTSFTTKKGTDHSLMILKRWKLEQKVNAGKETGKSEGAVETGQSQPPTQNPKAATDDEKPATRQADQPKEKADAGKKAIAVAKTDHEKLRGTWKVIEEKSRGKDQVFQKGFLWSIGKDRIVMTQALVSPGSPKKEDRQRIITYLLCGDLDDSAPSPNNIDITLSMFEVSIFPVKSSAMYQVGTTPTERQA